MLNGSWVNKKIGVLYGGISSEREVSLKTGKAISDALKGKDYQVVDIDPGHDLAEVLQANPIDVAFIALHGKFGEDGCVQGLLEWMKIPYTGSGVLASALAMNKLLSKKVFLQSSIPTPLFREVSADDLDHDLESLGLGAVVVKPACEGSSVGIQICKDDQTLKSALELAAKLDKTILVEQFVEGRELTVGVLSGEAMTPLEIVPAEGFYDYAAKYQSQTTRYLCPAPVSESALAEARTLAAQVHNSLGCRGVSRVDFLLDADDRLWVLEINTIPGMTATSLVPKMAAHQGLGFAELCEEILRDASLQR